MKVSDSRPSSGRVLVLGSKGFVAGSLLRELDLHRIAVKAVGASEIDLSSATASSLLEPMIETTDTIVFVSALTPDRGRTIGTMMANLRMAESVATVIEKRQPQRLVYISSDAVYSERESLIREDSNCDPGSLHGIMHLTREKMLADVCKRLSVPYLILRPCALYGANDTHNSYGPNRFLKTAREAGQISLIGQGEEMRDHLHVDDFSRIIVQCIRAEMAGIVNVATGRSISFGDAAKCVASKTGKHVEIQTAPRQAPPTHRHFDVSKLLGLLPGLVFTEFEGGITGVLQKGGNYHA